MWTARRHDGRAGAAQWDIVISDCSMPGSARIPALAVLRESGIELPFVVVSGTIGEETAVDALRGGAHDFVVKGKLARLVPAVERELDESRMRQARREAEEALRESEEYCACCSTRPAKASSASTARAPSRSSTAPPHHARLRRPGSLVGRDAHELLHRGKPLEVRCAGETCRLCGRCSATRARSWTTRRSTASDGSALRGRDPPVHGHSATARAWAPVASFVDCRRASAWRSSCARRRRWRPSAASPAASRTTSTTCCRSSSATPS